MTREELRVRSNIGEVFVGGQSVSRYRDLDDEPEWEAATDAGNYYRVIALGPSGASHRKWAVFQIAELGAELGSSVGRVRRYTHGTVSYEYSSDGQFVLPDHQGDLWNAVQGLTT